MAGLAGIFDLASTDGYDQNFSGMNNNFNSTTSNASRYINPTGNSNSLFGKMGGLQGIMSIGSSVLQGLTGLGQLYNAFQANKMMKEQFSFEKAAFRSNFANQAKVINNTYDSAANISAQLGATTPGEGLANKDIIEQYKNDAKSQHVASSIS